MKRLTQSYQAKSLNATKLENKGKSNLSSEKNACKPKSKKNQLSNYSVPEKSLSVQNRSEFHRPNNARNNENQNNNSIENETNQVMMNLKYILEEANMDFSNVVKTSIFLSDMSLFKTVNDIYGKYIIKGDEPARETIAVKTLPMSVNVEISMIASI